MKIIIQEQVPREVEITLPHYTKNIAHHYKIMEENKVMIVYSGHELTSCGIETHHYVESALRESNQLSNEEEFNEAFNQVINKLKDEKDR